MAVETVSRTDDIEAGCDLSFERRWWRVQRACWVVLAVLLAAGVAGLFGHGPLSDTTAESLGGTVHVRYAKLARRETPSNLRLSLTKPVLASRRVRVRLNQALVERKQLKQIIPTPLSTELLADGAEFTFATDPSLDSASIIFVESPTEPGVVEGEVAVEGAEPIHFRQFVYP